MSRPQKIGGIMGFVVLLGVGSIAAFSFGGFAHVDAWSAPTANRANRSLAKAEDSAALDATEPDSICLPPDVARKLGIRTAPAEKATQGRSLVLAGSLALESNRLARVHTRFAGEVVELGMAPDPKSGIYRTAPPAKRQVQLGDKVQKNQLMAVVWSKDLGEKKSELVDALSQLRLDEQRLEKLEEGFQRQAIPEASVRQARRDVEADLIAVARAERTLRVWRLAEAEITAVKEEADRIRSRQGKRNQDKEKDWARVEVRAPFDGVVLERNVALGDVVDTATDLFKIGDLSKLCVWAHAYENHLPDLVNLPKPIPWTIRLKADPNAAPLPGSVDMIGSIVDPTQHTAVLRGHVDNAEEKLRAGQFVTATVDLPPLPDEIVLPIAALVEDGQQSVVMVQSSPSESKYARRAVKVLRRGQDSAFVSGKYRPDDARSGLQPGDQVVTTGALALKAKLDELKALAK